MAKKFGKLVLFSALAGAAAAGTYYYLQNKAKAPEDDFDDFDDFDEDLDDEDFSADATASTGSKNHSLPIDIDSAKEIIGEKVIERLDRTKERIDKAKEIIGGMTSPTAETVYTEMDLSAATPVSDADANGSVSATYAEPSGAESASEEFFNDSEVK